MLSNLEHANAKVAETLHSVYYAVFFEDRGEWFIRCDDYLKREQLWSAHGYDRKAEAIAAYWWHEVTYTQEAPGKS
jgi:hypothetical protein